MSEAHPMTAQDEQGSRILLVEDDEFVRQTILWTLEEEGIDTAVAADGLSAISHLETSRPTLMLLDIGLPGVDGFGVADRLRTLYGSEVPVVVLTADGRAAEKARRVGAVAYLHKPFEIGDLIRVVRSHLDQ